MSRDDIVRMAREAGMVTTLAQMGAASLVYTDGCDGVALGELERFAALVAAHERELCAKVCEGRIGGAVQSNAWWSGFKEAMRQCAAAIRARRTT